MKAGDKVVCVDDSQYPPIVCENLDGMIEKGKVYLVEDTCEWEFHTGTQLGLYILGKRRRSLRGSVPWGAFRFRPVAEVGHPPIAVEHPQPCPAP